MADLVWLPSSTARSAFSTCITFASACSARSDHGLFWLQDLGMRLVSEQIADAANPVCMLKGTEQHPTEQGAVYARRMKKSSATLTRICCSPLRSLEELLELRVSLE